MSLLHRRELLRIGGLAVLAGAERGLAAGQRVRADHCIFLMLQGGLSHLESWDPKPEAPVEVRGPFGTIRTSLPGLRFGELFPR